MIFMLVSFSFLFLFLILFLFLFLFLFLEGFEEIVSLHFKIRQRSLYSQLTSWGGEGNNKTNPVMLGMRDELNALINNLPDVSNHNE